MKTQKRPYVSPKLKKWGTVADLTQAGETTPVTNDIKDGSNTTGQ